MSKIIQGGMGINISCPNLARTVSMLNQRGTISGVTADRMMVRKLQQGDPDGDIRRALSHFPFQEHAEKIVKKYYVEGGIQKNTNFKGVPFFSIDPPDTLISLTVCANFAFVWLAKEGHNYPVTINYLEKVSMPLIYGITGAMLAGIDNITMGAGIPLKIPEVISAILENRDVTYPVPVLGKNITSYLMSFNPEKFFGAKLPQMKRPGFIPIISSNLLANIFVTKLPAGSISAFIVEEPTAGGHNAPPRNKVGYSDKDYVNYENLAKMEIPFYIGGSYPSPEKLKFALSVGAAGIQAGSIFALSEESGMEPNLRKQMRKHAYLGSLGVKTDMKISPTGFPFKVAELSGTISESKIYENRERVCSQGGLIVLYEKPNGGIGYRCASEPIDKYLAKGGDINDTIGRGCLCNGLMSTAGIGDYFEPPVITIGDDLSFLKHLMSDEYSSYTAKDAIEYLLS